MVPRVRVEVVTIRALVTGIAALATASGDAFASEAGGGLKGSELGLMWLLPFVGILVSIALFPLLAPHFWHRNFGKVSLFWALAFAVPAAIYLGSETTLSVLTHTLI